MCFFFFFALGVIHVALSGGFMGLLTGSRIHGSEKKSALAGKYGYPQIYVAFDGMNGDLSSTVNWDGGSSI